MNSGWSHLPIAEEGDHARSSVGIRAVNTDGMSWGIPHTGLSRMKLSAEVLR